jgi:hypothetical protein
LGETTTFSVTREFTVGDGCDRGRGSQVVGCTQGEHDEPVVAKIYDPLYYPFADDDFPDLQVRIIDFNFVDIGPLLGADAPCQSEELPQSPLEWFWNSIPLEMEDWVPDGWEEREWNQWPREKWEGSARFRPVPENLGKQL